MPDGTFDTLLEVIGRRWSDRGVRLTTKLANADSFVHRVGLVPPREFIQFLERLGGMSEDATDGNLFSFWNAERIERNAASMRARYGDLIAFADFNYEATRYLLSCRGEDAGAVYLEGVSLVPVADSFATFLDHYLWDIGAILPGRGGGS